MIYALRTFQLEAGIFEEFARTSAEKIWPVFESQGPRIIGLWRTQNGSSEEAIVLTVYESLDQYEELHTATFWASVPGGQSLVQASEKRRVEMIKKVSVKILTSYEGSRIDKIVSTIIEKPSEK